MSGIVGLASEPIPPPDQAQAWLVCTLTHPEGSSGRSTYITGNISGGLCSLYCDGIRLEIIAFRLLFFPASLVEFLNQKPEKQQCLVTSVTTRLLDCSIPLPFFAAQMLTSLIVIWFTLESKMSGVSGMT
jgi:hypothetical protein